MDNPLTPEKQNVMIEDALRTYPLASMPRDITGDVMARIQAVPAPRPFRFTWTEIMLSVILSICVGAIWFTLQNLPPVVAAQVRKESILFYQYMLVNARWLVPTVFFTLAGFLAALTIPYLRQELTETST